MGWILHANGMFTYYAQYTAVKNEQSMLVTASGSAYSISSCTAELKSQT